MSDPKPYTVEEADCITHLAMELAEHATCDRLRATVAALEQVTRERDDLNAEVERLLERLKKADEVVALARTLGSYSWEDRLEDCRVSDDAKHDARELSIAVYLYDAALAGKDGGE